MPVLFHALRLMNGALRKGVFPGGALLAASEGIIRHFSVHGVGSRKTGLPVLETTLFDLASLTKPLATAMACMVLVQEGGLGLEWPIGRLFPERALREKEEITVGALLSHTAGLPPYRPFYAAVGRDEVMVAKQHLRELLLTEGLETVPGERMRYSDLGYMLLEWVVERASGMPLDRFFAGRICAPLKIGHLLYTPLLSGMERGAVAATEYCPWRRRVLSGEVHDENAYACGGVAGHAGLFGDARAVFRICQNLLETFHGARNPVFEENAVRLFFTEYGGSGRTPGFDRPSPGASSGGCCFSPSSVGHLGFTGTSFWMDLEKGIVVILLTNRVHPSRFNSRIRHFRPLLHDCIMGDLTGARVR